MTTLTTFIINILVYLQFMFLETSIKIQINTQQAILYQLVHLKLNLYYYILFCCYILVVIAILHIILLKNYVDSLNYCVYFVNNFIKSYIQSNFSAHIRNKYLHLLEYEI